MNRSESRENILETEFVRNLNCNYERILLEEKPKESRYQYCILSRGGIRFLLPCSLRYINGDAFLYYDISSTQNITQLFEKRVVKREWMRDFLWGMERMQQELKRFLLEDRCVIWNPEHIYQDLEKNDFYFMYVPYYQGNAGFKALLDFWVENIDYEDNALVEFVYGLHEKYDAAGDLCLDRQIYENFKELENREKQRQKIPVTERGVEREITQESAQDAGSSQPFAESFCPEPVDRRKGILSFLGGRRKKQDVISYQEILRKQIESQATEAVGEEICYGGESVPVRKKNEWDETGDEQEEYGRTVYLEEQQREQLRGLYRDNGELAVRIDRFPFVIGKKKEEVDHVLGDHSVSRVHARIVEEDGRIYLEDLNSTNGTFKNGLRLQPYEKRRLEKDDEVRFGKVEYIFQ